MTDPTPPEKATVPATATVPPSQVSRAAATLIAIAFAAGTLWNLGMNGPPMVTLGMASSTLFILGVPVGTALFGGRRND